MRRLVLALAGAVLAAASAVADDAVAPPSGARLLLKASAEGVQIYACQHQGSGTAWTLRAPGAVLRDPAGKEIGKHYAGPTWQALDGSTVEGEVMRRADAPGGNAIPWLLLRAKSHGGAGQFADVGFIQRIDTQGGLAPVAMCDTTMEPVRVPYSATYLFYARP